MTRRWCVRNHHPFTTSYHTKFPEYLRARLPVPLSLTYAWLRRFHNRAAVTMVATKSMWNELTDKGFKGLGMWSRGVDTALFRPREGKVLPGEAPHFLNVGRVAVEKNIEAFLKLDLPGTKVVIGDGPAFKELKAKYPEVYFLGPQTGETLAKSYASADVFVFPSLTDTFGLVQLEALASGVPVAAFPVTGPIDVLGNSGVGVMSQDLRQAALECLEIDRNKCRAYAETFSWAASSAQFIDHMELIEADTAMSLNI
jgi:glycosyltransferase involved in cell wall biosynthesis